MIAFILQCIGFVVVSAFVMLFALCVTGVLEVRASEKYKE